MTTILESTAALLVDLDLYNRGAYAYRTVDARTGQVGQWYRPQNHEEAVRLILLSRTDRMNSVGALLCVTALVLMRFTR